MSLAPGARLGVYEVLALIGAGGMGEVYRARDATLQRDVAIKVLPEAFAQDAERLMRFEREARTLAALNHPHIAAIYGFEESGGVRALVMELVEGPTLADKLSQQGSRAGRPGAGAARLGPEPAARSLESQRGLPLDEALAIARQIAEALEAAHGQGIIHRDLKPANIKVRDDGTVKVLDFGLAKALDPAPGSGLQTSGELSHSPTITSPAMMTGIGVILGTAAYMSPEQAKGRPADKRSDVWAFGCVLYEMLTGQRAFAGEDVSDTLADVLKMEPAWERLPASVPARIRQVLRACLQKNAKQRIGDMQDVRLALEGAFETTGPPTMVTATSAAPTRRLAWMAFAAALLVAVALAVPAVRHLLESPTEEPSLNVSVPLPANGTARFLEISPDGRRLLVSVFQDGRTRLYVRALDSPEWQSLSSADVARTPFWSPDSRFIGFFGDGALKVIPVAGGPARTLCSQTGLGNGGTWSPSGVILFGSEGGRLRRVDASGGPCAVVGKDDPQSLVRFPVFLPDGNHFLYTGATRGDTASDGVFLAALDDLTPRKILADYSGVVYAPPLAGGRAHLLFLRDTTLMAQPFDDATLEAVGDPFPVASRAATTMTSPQVAASVSNGTLVYLAGRSRETQLTWFDRSGKALGTAGPRARHAGVVLSPDGNAVLTNRTESSGQSALWLYDLARGSVNRFLPPGPRVVPAWFPDGGRVLFRMTPGPTESGLYQRDATGAGKPELLSPMSVGASFLPSAFSRDGRFLVYTVVDPKTRADIWFMPWDAKPDLSTAVKFVATDATESQGQVSPDLRWIAYTSDETGENEVYIRPFPDGPGRWKASLDGGFGPRWSADGKQIYYARVVNNERNTLRAAAVEADGRGGFRTGTPQTLFDVRSQPYLSQANIFLYSPHPDGQRFLVNVLAEEGEATINVLTNWLQAVSGKAVP